MDPFQRQCAVMIELVVGPKILQRVMEPVLSIER